MWSARIRRSRAAHRSSDNRVAAELLGRAAERLEPNGLIGSSQPIPRAPVMIGVDSFVAGQGAVATERDCVSLRS